MSFFQLFNPNDFIGRAVWVLLALSLLTAPMGCFVVWRKLSFFGATLAHSSLLGAILGLLLGMGVFTGVLGFTTLLALGLSYTLHQRQLSGDTILGMIAHLSLSAGVIAVSLFDELRIDLMSYLFGDVLAVSNPLFYSMLGLSLLGFVLIIFLFRGFVNLSLCRDIAMVEGFSIRVLELVFVLMLSLTITLGLFSVGVLLIVALLIIPAAVARLLAKSLYMMVFWAWLITVVSILLGIGLAFWFNLPAGPCVVLLSGICFVVIYLARYCQQLHFQRIQQVVNDNVD